MKGKKNEGKLSDRYADQTISARQRGRLILIWMCWCYCASGFCLNFRALDNPKGDVAHSTMGAKIPLCSCPATIVIHCAACWWLMLSICRRTPLLDLTEVTSSLCTHITCLRCLPSSLNFSCDWVQTILSWPRPPSTQAELFYSGYLCGNLHLSCECPKLPP